MSTLDELKNSYKSQVDRITDLEKQIEAAKSEKSRVAKEIHDLNGDHPFDLDGKEVVARQAKGTYFLGSPLRGGRKKSETT